jgi:arylformamidase
MNRRSGWIDISIPLATGMIVYPGDPAVRIEREQDIARGDVATVSLVSMSAHSGTHVDAPLHFFREGKSIDRVPFDAMTGKARVIEIRDNESIKPPEIEASGVKPGEILLFKTRNSALWADGIFNPDYVYITTETAALLAKKRVKTIGMDYLSVGGFERNEAEAHRVLLEASIWIIEGLDLSTAWAGVYEFVCLPLRIADGEAAPARAIIRPL